MYFIDAYNLLTQCIEHGILTTQDDNLIFVQHEKGPVLWDKSLLAQTLMHDEEGQKTLLSALKKKGIEFRYFDFGPINQAIKHFTPNRNYKEKEGEIT